MAENQWPDIDVGPQTPTVRRILLEEGAGIAEKSRGAIRFEVDSRPHGKGRFVHQCFLVAPLLAYRYPFMRVEHGLDQYPLDLVADTFPSGTSVGDENTLRSTLGLVFRSDATKKVIVQLMDAISGHVLS